MWSSSTTALALRVLGETDKQSPGAAGPRRLVRASLLLSCILMYARYTLECVIHGACWSGIRQPDSLHLLLALRTSCDGLANAQTCEPYIFVVVNCMSIAPSKAGIFHHVSGHCSALG